MNELTATQKELLSLVNDWRIEGKTGCANELMRLVVEDILKDVLKDIEVPAMPILEQNYRSIINERLLQKVCELNKEI